MSEAPRGYQRWTGTLSPKSRVVVIAGDEVRRVAVNTWSLLAVGAGLAWGLASAIELYQIKQAGEATHDIAGFLDMLGQLQWFVVVAAALVGTPMLLEDARRGALELYLSRSVTRFQHVAGKAVALVALTALMFVVPILLYTLGAYVFFDQQPARWTTAPWAGVAYGLLWALFASGLALGMSCLARNSRAAALALIGALVVLHVTATNLLPGLTEATWPRILSPFNAMQAVQPWLWRQAPPGDFPAWWGLTEILALTALGWGLVWRHHPRLRGEGHD